jgi:hypothetical protein
MDDEISSTPTQGAWNEEEIRRVGHRVVENHASRSGLPRG